MFRYCALRFHEGCLSHAGSQLSCQWEGRMNWDQIEGRWKQYSGRVKEQWGKLTDDDLTTIGGKRDQLVGKLRERYGIAKDQAERQIDEFTHSLSDVSSDVRDKYRTHIR